MTLKLIGTQVFGMVEIGWLGLMLKFSPTRKELPSYAIPKTFFIRSTNYSGKRRCRRHMESVFGDTFVVFVHLGTSLRIVFILLPSKWLLLIVVFYKD